MNDTLSKNHDAPGPSRARRLLFSPLALKALLLAWGLAPACKGDNSNKSQTTQMPTSRCPKANVGWTLKSPDAPYRRAGLSTNPAGREERLMPKVLPLVQQWSKACRAKGQWTCSSAVVVGFLTKDAQGTLTSVQALTPCSAALCLAKEAAHALLPGGPPGTDICVYLQLAKK